MNPQKKCKENPIMTGKISGASLRASHRVSQTPAKKGLSPQDKKVTQAVLRTIKETSRLYSNLAPRLAKDFTNSHKVKSQKKETVPAIEKIEKFFGFKKKAKK